MHKRVIATVMAACIVTLFGVTPGTASAAANPYTPTGVCGSSYYERNSMPVQYSGATWGRVYLMYSNTTRKNCVVTLKSSYVGTKTTTTAWIEARNGAVGIDEGNYAYYANSYVYAPGSCVWYGGYVYSGANKTGVYASASSNWGWCN
jgi:hypothetical protein